MSDTEREPSEEQVRQRLADIREQQAGEQQPINPEGEKNTSETVQPRRVPLPPRKDAMTQACAAQPTAFVDQFRLALGPTTAKLGFGQQLENGQVHLIAVVTMPLETFLKLANACQRGVQHYQPQLDDAGRQIPGNINGG